MFLRVLQLLTTLFGWIWNRAERERARADAETARVEAMRQRAANQETVDRLKNGEAEEALRKKWNRGGTALLVLAALLSGCASPATVVVDTGCDWARPILVDDADQFTDGTARQILVHNETWQGRCKR